LAPTERPVAGYGLRLLIAAARPVRQGEMFENAGASGGSIFAKLKVRLIFGKIGGSLRGKEGCYGCICSK
jgi:hypothetical protein